MTQEPSLCHPSVTACYCFACDMGLEAGGANAHHMIELVSGMFREG